MQSSAPGKEQPQAQAHTGDQLVGKKLCKKELAGPCEQQQTPPQTNKHKLAMSQQYALVTKMTQRQYCW